MRKTNICRGEGPTPPRHRLLTIHEVAELGGMSVSTARRMIREGKLPGPQELGMPQLQRWHPGRVRAALGLEDLPEAGE